MGQEVDFKEDFLSKYIDPPMWFYLLNKFPNIDEDILESQLTELVKYLYITSCISSPLLVTQELDEIWHSMILETKAYYEFCMLMPGKKYIHHSSNDYESEKKPSIDESIENEIVFYANYVKEFKGFTESNIVLWPGALAFKEASNCKSIADLNGFLIEVSA